MKEKFSDYEGGFLETEGEFEFEITNYELQDKAKGMCAVFEARSEVGQTTLFHSLNPKARFSYNKLVKACLHINTPEKIKNFEFDYEVDGNLLVGKKFIGVVEAQSYEKDIKKPNDDGTFSTDKETKTGYKIVEYREVPVK